MTAVWPELAATSTPALPRTEWRLFVLQGVAGSDVRSVSTYAALIGEALQQARKNPSWAQGRMPNGQRVTSSGLVGELIYRRTKGRAMTMTAADQEWASSASALARATNGIF